VTGVALPENLQLSIVIYASLSYVKEVIGGQGSVDQELASALWKLLTDVGLYNKLRQGAQFYATFDISRLRLSEEGPPSFSDLVEYRPALNSPPPNFIKIQGQILWQTLRAPQITKPNTINKSDRLFNIPSTSKPHAFFSRMPAQSIVGLLVV